MKRAVEVDGVRSTITDGPSMTVAPQVDVTDEKWYSWFLERARARGGLSPEYLESVFGCVEAGLILVSLCKKRGWGCGDDLKYHPPITGGGGPVTLRRLWADILVSQGVDGLGTSPLELKQVPAQADPDPDDEVVG